jgi:hypothetical protein
LWGRSGCTAWHCRLWRAQGHLMRLPVSRDFAYQERKLLRWISRGPQGSDEASNALMEFEYVAQRREREDEVLLTCSLILEVRDFLQHPKWEVRRTDQASAVRDRGKEARRANDRRASTNLAPNCSRRLVARSHVCVRSTKHCIRPLSKW